MGSQMMTGATASRVAMSKATPSLRDAYLALLVLIAATAFRLGLLQAAPIYDELYHVLAARSWIEDGSFRILDGNYDRAPLFTMLVGLTFDAIGQPTVTVARLPALICGALLVSAIFLWTRRAVGPTAGWIAAGFAVLWPSGILISQLTRFYALHGLLFFLGAVAAYAAATSTRGSARWIALAVSALCFTLAAQFQITTAIGVLAVLIWAALFVVGPAIWTHQKRWRLIALTFALSVGSAVAVLVLAPGSMETLWTTYRYVPWETDIFQYHRVLRDFYPTFWPLFPVAALIALRAYPRQATFCVTLFGFCVLIHSFAGFKSLRYIYYVTPFFFVIWGMAFQAVLPTFRQFMGMQATNILSRLSLGADPWRSWLVQGLIAAIALFVLVANPAAQRSLALAVGIPAKPDRDRQAWTNARSLLQPWLNSADIVVAINDLYAIEYVGDFDLVYSNNRFRKWGNAEFVVDPRTGRPLISNPASLEQVVRCRLTGILLAMSDWWRPPQAFDALEALTRPGARLSTLRAGSMTAVRWETPAVAEHPACVDIPDGKGR